MKNYNEQKIAAVIVTFNRLQLLKECIASIKNQTRKVDEVIVVNNSSTDGTFEWLSEQKDLTVITQENSGSAGGQYTGMKYAYEKEYDWIWCLDTDVVPESKALEQMLLYTEVKGPSLGFLTSMIFHSDGELAHINIPELDKSYNILSAFVKNEPIPILSASFSSLLIPRHILKEVGYPIKEFFIWGDDAEFTLRISLHNFNGFLVPNSIAYHFNETNNPTPYLLLSIRESRFNYGVRNMVYVAILRNKLTHNSILRGYLSGIGFISKVFSQKKSKNILKNLELISKLILLYFRGIFFNPKPEYPMR